MHSRRAFRSHLNISNVAVDLVIDQAFVHIKFFFDNFQHITKTSTRYGQVYPVKNIKVVFRCASRRSIKVSPDHQSLLITGSTIDDLNNPFNIIGILQAVFRFVGMHTAKSGVVLLHGSTAYFKGRAFCFGDDGKSTAKTMSSLECGLQSDEYLGDEFCFLDVASKLIFSYPFIPIHIRPQVKTHLAEVHGVYLKSEKYGEGSSGVFIDPGSMFHVQSSHQITAFVFVHFDKNITRKVKLVGEKSRSALLNCISAPIIKLLYPDFDRMRFADETDSNHIVQFPQVLLNEVARELALPAIMEHLLDDVPCYRFYVQKACDVRTLLNQLV